MARKITQQYVVEDKGSQVVKSATKKITSSLDSVGKKSIKTTSAMSSGFKGLSLAGATSAAGIGTAFTAASGPLLAITAGIAAVTVAFKGIKKSVTIAAEFEKEMANVSTLVDTSKVSMKGLEQEIKKLPNTLGSATENAKALYQAISAGVEPAKAVAFVGEAAKAAKAGLTDTFTAVDSATSVLNAYGMSSENITKINDQMFTAVKLGKTTFGELGSSIGKVAPLASTLNVSTGELFSSLTSLTKQGINTSEAVTGLKSAFSNVIKPGKQAQEMAKELGLQFDSAAVDKKGFVNFLKDVKAKVGDNKEAFAKLFPNIQGLNAVLALTKDGGEDLSNTLEKMGGSTGETETAFKKQTATMGESINRLKVTFGKIGLIIGEKIIPAITKMTSKLADFLSHENTLKAIEGTIAVIAKAWDLIAIALKMVVNGIKLYVEYIKVFITIGKNLYEVLTGQKTVTEGLADSWKAITEFFGKFMDYIKESVGDLLKWVGVLDKVAAAANKVGGVFKKIGGFAKGVGKSALGAVGIKSTTPEQEAELAKLLEGVTDEKKQIEIMIKFMGEASTVKPLGEKMEEIKGWFSTMTASISKPTTAVISFKDEAGNALSDSMDKVGDGFRGFFDDVITGTGSVSDAFKMMTQDISMSIADMLKDQAIDEFMGLFGGKKGVGSFFSGLFGGGGGGYGLGDLTAAQSAGALFAKGGIAYGGLTPLQSGGVIRRPTPALVGEGNQNEAVVPLPDGRSIPVTGGTQEPTQNNFVIQAMDSESFFNYLQRNPEAVVSVLSEEVNKGNQGLSSTISKATRMV